MQDSLHDIDAALSRKQACQLRSSMAQIYILGPVESSSWKHPMLT